MAGPGGPSHVFRFPGLEVDLRAGELRKGSERIKLQEQPLQILRMLLERPGEIVTREEIQQKLWPTDTFVEFDHSINAAIQRLRQALGDSAEDPRFVETMARRGYRFIAPVDVGAGFKPAPTTSAALRWAAIAVAGVVLVAAVLLALNIAGLRERLMAVGAGLVPALGRPRGAPLPKIESIAVLPLENLSRDPEQEYFADGMTDELITNLGKISALRVISRTSVMRYKQTKKPLPEIAKELNVDAVVEGTVQRSGERVRIRAQLLHARLDRHLWAESYERDAREVLALQGEVAQAISHEIQIKLTPQERTRLGNARPVNPEAYDLYLKGRYQWNKRSEEALKKSLEYFQQAAALDPNYALAYAGVADTYNVLGNNVLLPGTDSYPKAKTFALKALRLDDGLAEAHASLASVLFDYDRDHTGALEEDKRAIELNPNYANAHHFYALHLALMGRSEEAIREIEQARRLDPLSLRINANVALVYLSARQYDRAITEAGKALELEPNDPMTRYYLATVYLLTGKHQEALNEIQKVLSLPRAGSGAPFLLALAYIGTGKRQEALKIIARLEEQSKREFISPYYMARIYVALAKREEALASLRKAIDIYDGATPNLKVDPLLDPLRSDARFQDLLRRMNFPP